MSITVGLTGGIATGKSTVAQLWQERGAAIINADQIAREVVRPGEPALAQIAKVFGQEVLGRDGELERKALARLVFGDPAQLKLLNAITHPPILQLIRERIAEQKAAGVPVIIVEAPLLIETGLHRLVDKVVLVTASVETQITRLKERDGLTRDEALARIRSQLSVEEKLRWADYIIDTDLPYPEVVRQVQDLWEEIIGGKNGGIDRSWSEERRYSGFCQDPSWDFGQF